MTDTLPKGRILRLEFELELPCEATHDQIEEWLDLELACGSCSVDNPLSQYGLEAIHSPTITDMQQHRVREHFSNPDGTTTIRSWTVQS